MNNSSKRKLHRSTEDKILAGIFGGLGEYFDIDSNLLRLIALFLLFLTFFGALFPFLVMYFIAMFIIPSDRDADKKENEGEGRKSSCQPVHKKWWFWLIIAILLLPVILIILGFVLFAARGGFAIEETEIREERVIESPEDSFDHIEIDPEE